MSRPSSSATASFSQKGMEPVRLEKTEISEAGQITNMRFRFAG